MVVIDIDNDVSNIVWHCSYQLVLVPRNQAASAFCTLKRELKMILASICRRLDADILSLEITSNHVYIQFSVHPRNSPLEVVQSLKKRSSGELFRRYSDLFHTLKGKSFWSDGCLLYTKSLSRRMIQNYIRERLEADWWEERSCNHDSL